MSNGKKMTKFIIERQESLAQDKFSKNGVSKELHIVAKAIPFTLHVASSVNLNESPVTAKLVYDYENESEEEKEVDTLKSSPIEYVSHVTPQGDKAAIEVKLSVLSSQHEGAYFRVKFSVTDPSTKKTIEALSHPIKVISKRNQVKKMLARNEISAAENPQVTLPNPQPPKRTATDVIAETLLRLEQQQRDQAKLLNQLVMKSSDNVHPTRNEDNLEIAFKNFVAAFNSVPSEERPNKIRRIASNSTPNENVSLQTFVQMYNAECSGNTSGAYPAASNHSEPNFIDMGMLDLASSSGSLGDNGRMKVGGHSDYLDDHHDDKELDDLYSDLLSSPHSPATDESSELELYEGSSEPLQQQIEEHIPLLHA